MDGLRVIRSMVKEFYAPDLDPNLAMTVVYNRSSNTVAISRDDLVMPMASRYAFYAGPQLIQNGQITTNINNNTSHRQRRAVRTFMIIDMDGKPHL